jgi:hypothetical protein
MTLDNEQVVRQERVGRKLTASVASAGTCQTLRPCCWRSLIAAGSR